MNIREGWIALLIVGAVLFGLVIGFTIEETSVQDCAILLRLVHSQQDSVIVRQTVRGACRFAEPELMPRASGLRDR